MGQSKKSAIRLVVPLIVGLSLLLSGWGVDDVGGFVAHPARAGLLVVALLGIVAALVLRLDLQVFRKGKRPVGRQRWLLAGLMVVGLSLGWFLPYGDRRGLLIFAGADALRYLGLALYAGGNLLALVALRALGKQYSGYVTLQDNHELVQTGIYGVIRHPIYLRAILVMLGLPLVFRSWLALPALALGAVFAAARIRQEEKLLAEQFGAEFEVYRRRTWRLLPFVY